MAKKRANADRSAKRPAGDGTEDLALDFRHHHARRPNNPTAANAAEGKVEPTTRHAYSYDPHRPPTLRFDAAGRADRDTDRAAELLAAAQERPLNAAEANELAEMLRQGQPWLEWAGKREQPPFVVDAPPIHIHERISTRALLRIAARRDVQRSLFGETDQPYAQSVQFYRHAVDWSNRMILGDNRAVMASLAHREGLAGKVQLIFIDPPYGIRYGSNFQPEIGRRDVKDSESDVTREMETVQAYRDTWNLGIHSYLGYIRASLLIARELLNDSGCVFFQIGDTNLHHAREIFDEVFGPSNFVSLITFVTTTGSTGDHVSKTSDYLLFYAKDKSKLKYRNIYNEKSDSIGGDGPYSLLEFPDGLRRRMTAGEKSGPQRSGDQRRIYRIDSLQSQSGGREKGEGAACWFPVCFEGKEWRPSIRSTWKTNESGMSRLGQSCRFASTTGGLYYVRYLDDFSVQPITNNWHDTVIAGFSSQKSYVVETSTKVIQRCILMATDPGDLVLDPTCGSGTTAYVAEQWGRRWITIDTSRVALAIARQRLMTAKFDYYRLRDEVNGPTGGFYYKTVPHITLKSIAQNAGLDPIFARHEPILADRLGALNDALALVTSAIRARLEAKLAAKRKVKDRDDPVTDADERRWKLPAERWEEWEVPFDTDPDWPEPLKDALLAYRKAWRAKMDEVNAAIAANAEQEPLVDQPEVVKGIVRVSGPFTVEALQPAEEGLDAPSPVDEPDGDLETFAQVGVGGPVANAEAYREKMLRLLRADGVRFPNNRHVTFDRLDPMEGSILSAAGEWRPEGDSGEPRRVAVAFGPQYGPVSGGQVDQCLRAAHKARVFDDLVFAGFSFDAAAQTTIQDDPNQHIRCHLAFIRPDVNLDGLLKETPNSQLFTVFGLPRASLIPCGNGKASGGQYLVRMEGVDVYDPVRNEIRSTGADKVAAWFVDTDYDGRTFCICQAFFPNRSAWDKLGKALKGLVDEDKLASLSGTESQPFDPPEGDDPRVAVKVIDPRGNEVLKVLNVPRGA